MRLVLVVLIAGLGAGPTLAAEPLADVLIRIEGAEVAITGHIGGNPRLAITEIVTMVKPAKLP